MKPSGMTRPRRTFQDSAEGALLPLVKDETSSRPHQVHKRVRLPHDTLDGFVHAAKGDRKVTRQRGVQACGKPPMGCVMCLLCSHTLLLT
jgi:hypothetical protein